MSDERKRSCRIALTLTWLMILGLAMGLSVPPDQAYAIPLLQLSDGVSTVTITDGLAGDLNSVEGAVTFGGSVGNFFVNVSTGISYPTLGTSTLPYLDLSSVNVSSSSGGTLTIRFTQTDFSNTSGSPFLITSEIGGVTQGTVSYQSYFDASNTAFGTASLLGNLGPFSGAFSGSSLDNMTATGLYSLTLVTTITHAGGGSLPQSSSFNATLRVPEPGTVTLLGAVLLGIGLLTWRQKSWRGSSLTVR